MRTTSRILALGFFGIIAAAVTNAARPNGLPWVKPSEGNVYVPKVLATFTVTLDEVKLHLREMSASFIDARRTDQFAGGHLPGAFNVPAEEPEPYMGPVFANVAPDNLVIIYCDGGDCLSSKMVFEHLKASGFRNLRIFDQGWALIEKHPEIARETGAGQYTDPAMRTGNPAGSGS